MAEVDLDNPQQEIEKHQNEHMTFLDHRSIKAFVQQSNREGRVRACVTETLITVDPEISINFTCNQTSGVKFKNDINNLTTESATNKCKSAVSICSNIVNRNEQSFSSLDTCDTTETDHIGATSIENFTKRCIRNKHMLHYSFVAGIVCFIFMSTCSLSIFIIWLIMNGGLFALQSYDLLELYARSYDEYKHRVSSLNLGYHTNYNLTINIMDTSDWPDDANILHSRHLLELHVFGSLSSLALVNIISQSTRLKKVFTDSSQNSVCKTGINEIYHNGTTIRSSHASIKILVLSNLVGNCASLVEVLNDNIGLEQLEELTFLNSSFTERNAFIMQTMIRQSRDTLKVLKFVDGHVDVNYFNMRNIGILRSVEELVVNTKQVTNSLRKVFDYFPRLVNLTLGQQLWDLNEIEYFSSATLKRLEITLNIPVGQQNVSIAYMTQRFPVLEGGIIKIKFPTCNSNLNYIVDTHKVPKRLLTNLKFQSNCKIVSI